MESRHWGLGREPHDHHRNRGDALILRRTRCRCTPAVMNAKRVRDTLAYVHQTLITPHRALCAAKVTVAAFVSLATHCTMPAPNDLDASDASVSNDRGSDTGRMVDAISADTMFDGAQPMALDAMSDGAVDVQQVVRDATVNDVPPAPCTTRITYGSAWMHPPGHAESFDDAEGRITWDGVCHVDGPNSYAVLSNGWRPYFAGTSGCIIALDASASCRPSPTCTTRITYGAAWRAPAGHTDRFDDVNEVVTWDGYCTNQPGNQSSAQLSNGWGPFFNGQGACAVSLRYEQCGGLFANTVVDVDCPDPGVVLDNNQYVMACTGGDYALRVSSDLIHWRNAGTIFAPGRRPSWANGDFWAPEIHRVGARWVAYFSARNSADGSLAVGAATGPTALGPFTDIGRPLVHDPNPGVIDAHHFLAPDGTQYLLYKIDGNAVRAPTPIYAQRLGADGVSLVGARTELIRNTEPWEGALVEGPWMIFENGFYYLFYSANAYASTRYAVGVARSRSPLGPFVKASEPILTSNAAYGGPGHGSVVRGPRGEWVHVYHSWLGGRVGGDPGRLILADRITWSGDWPHMFSAPSPRSQPLL